MVNEYAGELAGLHAPFAFEINAGPEELTPTYIRNSQSAASESGATFWQQAPGVRVPARIEYEPAAQHGHLHQPHRSRGELSASQSVDWLGAFSHESRK